jgi:hypothetical protein
VLEINGKNRKPEAPVLDFHRIAWPPLTSGRLIRRYQRFLADVRLDTGETVTAHCPNSGRMIGCSEPGRPVYLSVHDSPKRKLRYTWELIDMPASLVGVNTLVPNRLVALAAANGTVPEFQGGVTVQTTANWMPAKTSKMPRIAMGSRLSTSEIGLGREPERQPSRQVQTQALRRHSRPQGQAHGEPARHYHQPGGKAATVQEQQGDDAAEYADQQSDGNRADGLHRQVGLGRLLEDLEAGCADHELDAAGDEQRPGGKLDAPDHRLGRDAANEIDGPCDAEHGISSLSEKEAMGQFGAHGEEHQAENDPNASGLDMTAHDPGAELAAGQGRQRRGKNESPIDGGHGGVSQKPGQRGKTDDEG